MNPTQLALLALLAGVFVGLLISAVAFLAWRARAQAQEQADGELPAGAREVLGALDEAALIVDASFTIVATSPSAELFGLFEGESIPGDELRELLRSSRGVPHSETGTLKLRRGVAPAEPRLIVARASSITPRFTLVLVRDITERERLAEMRRDFVANTSHELKTPVGAVTLLAEAIESAADDPEQVRSFASRLSAEAMRLGNLTSRIMSLSRLQSSDELTELRDVAIDEVVTSAIETHAIAAESAGVALVRGGDRGLYVRGDVQVLSEAVGNLIANAIVYSPPASQVGVGIRGNGDTVEIAVTDRGIGIPESEQQRVFERFYRADYARSRRTGGTGLGLSIVKHAVQRHGGEVQLWSRPGRGSTFTIRLPAIAAPDGAAPTPRKTRKKIARALPARTKGDPS
ncbi:ATP-binding protein [Microbacterium sp. NE2HP2]|jgi:two-component system sensor histidine kinase SenX3|uniref:sensor histidine kinase n=1 Tax=Microbacterium TaxID=33882 RepID=UPI000DCCB276|nr:MULTISPECIES: ATP-binding protein [Microbacterium]MDF2920193.1 two-component sensor histidine kinase [Microbacterium sp.]MDD7944795.1 ATP-binding protein [Microbacterium plantarum]RAZ31373.1 two-component sensor histidine kinase [Microbacterium sp. SMR1]WHE35199.1 ATP-binding protein [Microbacterium sp. BDGP8]WRK16303.1 ATP-binding protein [Microbacterium plantarum]